MEPRFISQEGERKYSTKLPVLRMALLYRKDNYIIGIYTKPCLRDIDQPVDGCHRQEQHFESTRLYCGKGGKATCPRE
jgi:hypothetical protein